MSKIKDIWLLLGMMKPLHGHETAGFRDGFMLGRRILLRRLHSLERESTLCYVENSGRYLMMLRNKKDKDINKNKWIGIGGGIEPGETPEECVVREAFEETGLRLKKPEYRGIVYFSDSSGYSEKMHLFTCMEYSGELHDCDEGELKWVEKSAVGSLPIWEGDRVFLRLLAEGAGFFELELEYDGDRLVRAEVR